MYLKLLGDIAIIKITAFFSHHVFEVMNFLVFQMGLILKIHG